MPWRGLHPSLHKTETEAPYVKALDRPDPYIAELGNPDTTEPM